MTIDPSMWASVIDPSLSQANATPYFVDQHVRPTTSGQQSDMDDSKQTAYDHNNAAFLMENPGDFGTQYDSRGSHEDSHHEGSQFG